MTFAPQFIHGSKAHLRPIQAEDHFRITQIAGNEAVARQTSSIPHPYPDGAGEAFVLNAMKCSASLWVLDAAHLNHSDVAGVIDLRETPDGAVELGYMLDSALWGLGYMSAAVTDLVRANPLNLSSLVGTVFQDNPASARVLTKAGFEYTGDDESFSIARNAIVQRWRYIYTYS